MQPIHINAYTLSCAIGTGIKAIRDSIASSRGGLDSTPWPESNISTWLGRVAELDTTQSAFTPQYETRNNQLALLAIEQDGFRTKVNAAVTRYGAHRCGVILGTSTSSIGRTEECFRRLGPDDHFIPEDLFGDLHNPHSTGEFVALNLGIGGPAITISTACSSSARAFASATRWLESGIVDAVVVGGVDSLCLSVMYGFNSLQLVSPEPCKPFDISRSGLSLGEAGGFALLSREATTNDSAALLGYGESLDAHHMSSAHPEGLGAELAMRAAAERAGVTLQDIDYLNLHGTGTRANDSVEGLVCNKLLTSKTVCSSTKSWTGHTLGAAGITEAIIAMETLTTGILPGTLNTTDIDPDTHLEVILENKPTQPNVVMSNSFGFGGNNCSLIFGRPA